MPAPSTVLYTRCWLAGFCVGVLCSLQLTSLPDPGVIAPLLAGTALSVYGRNPGLGSCNGLLVGLLLSGWQGHSLDQARLPLACTRAPVTLTGVVQSLPRTTTIRDSSHRQRFELQVHDIEPARCAGPRSVLLSYYGEQVVKPGQGWTFAARLRRPWGQANPGSTSFQAWYAASGIDALGSASGPARRALPLDQPWRVAHQRLRWVLSDRLAATPLSETARAVLLAITIADKSAIDHAFWTQLQHLGINHLMVISGLHIGMVAGVALLLGRLLCLPLRVFGFDSRRMPLWLALCSAFLYCALAGFSLSTQRAMVMLTCLVLAGLLRRTGRSGNAMLLALCVVLLGNSLAPLASGFWLSFIAVSALLWLGSWQPRRSATGAALYAHAFMALLMLPAGALWFGGASLIAAGANLLAVPLFGLWVVPLALLGASLALLDLGGAALLWQLAAWPVEQILQGFTGRPDWLFLQLTPRLSALWLAAVGAALLAMPISHWYRTLACLLLLPLLMSPNRGQRPLEVVVLDVGQGTAVAVMGAGKALLYDTGGGDPAGANLANSVVLPFLRSQGIGRLDDFVISHGDRDHAAGLETVLSAMPVERLWQGGAGPLHTRASPCVAGRAWRWPDGTRFRFLSPAGREGLSSNDASCVLLVESGRGRVLLAGDIGLQQEYALLRYWRDTLAAQVLLVGHHGSGSSTSQAWLNRVRPRVSVVNNAYGNRFGHPHPAVMERLDAQGSAQWETWRSGAVHIAFDAEGMPHPEAWRAEEESWWK